MSLDTPGASRPIVAGEALDWTDAAADRSSGRDRTTTVGSAADGSAADPAIRAAIADGRLADAVAMVERSYGRSIRRWALRLVRDSTVADDVTQESLLRILRSLPTLRPDSRLGAWISSVVHNCAKDELRRRARQQRRMADGVDLAGLIAEGTPAAAIEADEAIRALLRGLDTLGPQVRASVVLYFGHELTFEQVGAMLHERAGAVNVRVSRALTRLRRHLERRSRRPASPVVVRSPAAKVRHASARR